MTDTRNRTRKIALSGILTALVFVVTYLIKIPIPATEGYVNPGDAVILISAFILGPYAAIPAAIGSALSDLLAGYAVYILPTFIIKGAMGLVAGLVLKHSAGEGVSFGRRLVAFTAAELIMVGGYFAFESMPFMYGVAAALVSVPFNLIQGLAGMVMAFPLSYVKVIGTRKQYS